LRQQQQQQQQQQANIFALLASEIRSSLDDAKASRMLVSKTICMIAVDLFLYSQIIWQDLAPFTLTVAGGSLSLSFAPSV
jgi:hypothetical protein